MVLLLVQHIAIWREPNGEEPVAVLHEVNSVHLKSEGCPKWLSLDQVSERWPSLGWVASPWISDLVRFLLLQWNTWAAIFKEKRVIEISLRGSSVSPSGLSWGQQMVMAEQVEERSQNKLRNSNKGWAQLRNVYPAVGNTFWKHTPGGLRTLARTVFYPPYCFFQDHLLPTVIAELVT